MRMEDYGKRNYRAYKEIHNNCVIDKERIKQMTITECMEMYIDVVRHLQLKTTTERCKAVIKLFRKNMVVDKWNETTDYDVKGICEEVFTNGGYCDATIKQMVAIVFSSIRFARDIVDDSCENKTENRKSEKNKRNINIIGLKEKEPVFSDLKVGECFLMFTNKNDVYMKIETKQTKGYYKSNAVCLNDGIATWIGERCKVTKLNINITAEVEHNEI